MTQPEPLTVAFMAIGAQKVLDRHPELANQYGGELELIRDVIRHADQADEMAQQNPGVESSFELEVAEPLGRFIVERILVRERDMDGAVHRHTVELVNACCSQEQER
jgi:hypothetical protein